MAQVLIRTADLNEGWNRFQFTIPAADLAIEEMKLVKPVEVAVEVQKSGEKLFVTGTVVFEAEFSCAWCAKRFSKTFEERFEQEYQRFGSEASEPALELKTSEFNREFCEGETADILPLVRDTILLAAPLAPICRDGCKGICPACGINRNENECSCEVEEPSPWKEELKKLQKKM